MIYSPESFNGYDKHIRNTLDSGESVPIKRYCYNLKSEIEIAPNEEDYYDESDFIFVVGQLEGDYFLLDKEVFYTENNFYFEKSFTFDDKTFRANRDISILGSIDRLVNTDVYVGGLPRVGYLPTSEYMQLIKTFPSSTEMTHYAQSRISRILRNYFDGLGNIEIQYEKYLNRKTKPIDSSLYKRMSPLKLETFKTVLETVKQMLGDSESYLERDWQEVICDIVRLLYPKYILAKREIVVGNDGRHDKKPDFLLIDSNGYVDVLEIKKPHNQKVITSTEYRNNYVADRDLEGAIVQIEKYLFTMNRYGEKLEEKLQMLLKNELVPGMKIKVSNPQGMLLMGRSNCLSHNQSRDFEIIKRQHKNIIDFMTYDDLVQRLENIVASIENIES